DSGVVTFGEAGGGDVEAVVAGFPGGAETQAWLSSPDGSVNSGVRLTFGAAPGTMAASSVVVRLYTSVPVGFTAWDTVALELDYGFAISGASPGSSAFVALGMLGDTDDIGTVATYRRLTRQALR
ncbi:MAG: hypothetical protein ACE5D3_05515, partial [Candidatus Binatia bacterium]